MGLISKSRSLIRSDAPSWRLRPELQPGLPARESIHACLPGDFAGIALAEVLLEGPLEVEQAVLFAAELASVCSHLHEQGRLHLAIHPVSVLLTPEAKIRLLRPSVAAALEIPTGLQPGSWQAPELRDGGPPTPASDIYSIGATFVSMLRGRRGLHESRRVARVPETVPAELALICTTAMHPRPENRFASTEQMARELGQLLGSGVAH